MRLVKGQANEALGRFADLYDSGHIPEFREVNQVDTIVAWGVEILAYHSSRRASNGPRWRGSTTSSRSYDESLTGSPTMAITQAEESS